MISLECMKIVLRCLKRYAILAHHHSLILLAQKIPSKISCSSAYSEEAYYAINPCEDEQLPYNNWRDFWRKYESCLTFGDYWDDELSSYGNSTDTNGNGSGLRGREECSQGEEQRDIYSGLYENKETEFSYYDDSPWSGYESWFDERKGDTLYYGGYEHGYAYSNSLDEIGIWEGLFGYWPCLTRKHLTASGE